MRGRGFPGAPPPPATRRGGPEGRKPTNGSSEEPSEVLRPCSDVPMPCRGQEGYRSRSRGLWCEWDSRIPSAPKPCPGKICTRKKPTPSSPSSLKLQHTRAMHTNPTSIVRSPWSSPTTKLLPLDSSPPGRCCPGASGERRLLAMFALVSSTASVSATAQEGFGGEPAKGIF